MSVDGTRELICKTWIQHTASGTSVAQTPVLLAASNVAGIGTFSGIGTNTARTRFCEVSNHGTNNAYVKLYTTGTTGSGTAAATTGDRMVPGNNVRIFQVPQGGQGILSCMVVAGTGVLSVNWGIGRG